MDRRGMSSGGGVKGPDKTVGKSQERLSEKGVPEFEEQRSTGPYAHILAIRWTVSMTENVSH